MGNCIRRLRGCWKHRLKTNRLLQTHQLTVQARYRPDARAQGSTTVGDQALRDTEETVWPEAPVDMLVQAGVFKPAR